MAEIVVQVCDECREVGKPVKTYTVSEGGRAGEPVLCADDGAVLERFLPKKPAAKKAPARPVKKAARGGTRSRIKTMEEIEAEKAARR
jgi:hypothetical protein